FGHGPPPPRPENYFARPGLISVEILCQAPADEWDHAARPAVFVADLFKHFDVALGLVLGFIEAKDFDAVVAHSVDDVTAAHDHHRTSSASGGTIGGAPTGLGGKNQPCRILPSSIGKSL